MQARTFGVWSRWCVALFAAMPVLAPAQHNLLAYHAKALERDAGFLGARASFEAEAKNRDIAATLFRPSVSLNLGKESSHLQRQDVTGGPSRSYDYAPLTGGVRLSQPLFDKGRSAAQAESRARAQRAEHAFAAAQADLALRLSQAYFNYLLALDQQRLAEAQAEALQAQVRQLEALVVSRTATRTELAEAQARLELSRVQVRATGIALQSREREFAKITGEAPSKQMRPLSQSPRLVPLEPNHAQAWVATALAQNAEILAQKATIVLSQATLERARAGLYPRVTLDASSQHGSRPSYQSRYEQTYNIGINLSMSLYEGGSTSALSEQAELQLQRARFDLLQLEQEQTIKVHQLFDEISNAKSQIQAMELAERSALLALEGIRLGIKASVRTYADELASVQQLYAVRRDLQRERYSFLVSWIALQAMAGTPPADALSAIERLLPNQ